MGGDEFILVQKSVFGRDDAERMAQRIFESVSAPYCIENKRFREQAEKLVSEREKIRVGVRRHSPAIMRST